MLFSSAVAVDQYIEKKFTKVGFNFFKNSQNVPTMSVAIVLGAAVWPTGPSDILKDRLLTVLDLFKKGKVSKIIVSGDHSHDYDEVYTMARYLRDHGIPKKKIWIDSLGYSTSESMQQVSYIFGVKQAVVVTQEFHLPRSLFYAEMHGIRAIGMVADRDIYRDRIKNRVREFFARGKAFFDFIIFNPLLKNDPKSSKDRQLVDMSKSGLVTWKQFEK